MIAYLIVDPHSKKILKENFRAEKTGPIIFQEGAYHKSSLPNGDILCTRAFNLNADNEPAFIFRLTGEVFFGKAVILREEYEQMARKRFLNCDSSETYIENYISFCTNFDSEILRKYRNGADSAIVKDFLARLQVSRRAVQTSAAAQ